MKKYCPSCERNRRIDKKWSKNKSKPDNLQSVCNDCLNEMKKEYRKTYRVKNLERNYLRKWRSKNKEKVKKYCRDYYRRNKERFFSKKMTKSILISENTSKININKRGRLPKDDNLVINPQRRKK